MKEYISGTGGRYTYTDDILNLQELALSMTSIFEACSNFIISGCEASGSEITKGYVWINGKVRFFEGAKDIVFPYYIYEKNTSDTVTYANEISKKGRENYLCSGSISKPTLPDVISGVVPQFIEVNINYSPRLVDKFFGKYAVLLDNPFTKQTIKKDLCLAGNIYVDKNIESKTAISIVNPENGYSLKNITKTDGTGSVGLYLNGMLVNEVIINTDGSFAFVKQDKVIARISDEEVKFSFVNSESSKSGAIYTSGNKFINISDDTDDGSIDINSSGLNDGFTRYRNFNVFNGKQKSNPLLQVIGKAGEVRTNGFLNVNSSGSGINISNANYSKTEQLLMNTLSWTDSANEKIGVIGYDSDNSFIFSIKNLIGNIVVSPKEYINIIGDLKINGTSIKDTYVTIEKFNNKIDAVPGKQLSTEDFTTEHKRKLDNISTGSLANGAEGYILMSEANEELKKKLTASKNLSDIDDKELARGNLNVYSKTDTDNKFASVTNLLQDYIAYQVGQGKTEVEAKEVLRSKLDCFSKKEITDNYLRKDSKLSDLSLADDKAKREACKSIGAAYADDYETKIGDTGWLQMANSGNSTDTKNLYVRQIGNIVCIQGTINTSKRDGSHNGGTVAILPNKIQPPKYSVKHSVPADFNDDVKYNRGSSFTIYANTRKVIIQESGNYNAEIIVNFTYMI